MNEYLSDPEEAKEFLPHYKCIYGLIAFTFVICLVSFWFLQVLQGKGLNTCTEKSRFKVKKITPP